ncbi:MAG TPA: DHA2 family efflux MFS transporter permease subunit [Candidatus Dormibacteraeota bacterium]
MSGGELSRRTKVLVTIGAMLSLLLAALDQTIVSTAMPKIIASLNGFDRYAWVATGYLVTSTVMTPIGGKLGDLFGRKPFLIAGMVGFMAMSWLCGFSQDMNQLIAFRALQGIFGGILFASVFTVVGDIYAPAERARIVPLFTGMFGLAAIFGPTAGGWITDHVTLFVSNGEGWRWIFYLNVPVGVLALIFISLYLPFVRSSARVRDIDFWGAATMAAGLGAILIGLSITNTHAWTSAPVLGLLAVGLGLMAVFFLVERREPQPIIPPSMFRNRVYVVSTLVGVLMSFAMFGSLFFVQLVYQGVLGQTATSSGAFFTPMMIGVFLLSAATGQLMVRIRNYQYLGTIGIALAAAGFWVLTRVTVDSSPAEVTAALVLIGAGMGATMPLYQTALQSAVDMKFLGVVSSNIQFWRNAGGTVATAILGSILVTRLPVNITGQLASAHLPPQLAQRLSAASASSGGGAQQLFSASGQAQLQQKLGPFYGTVHHAIQVGLANTLHELFLIGLAVMILALVASVFMPAVPLRRGFGPPVVEGPPVPEEPEAVALVTS